MGGRTRRLRILDYDTDQRLMEAMSKARSASVQGMSKVDYHSEVFGRLRRSTMR